MATLNAAIDKGSELTRVLMELANAKDDLRELVNNLMKRLEPVSRQEPSGINETKPETSYSSKVSSDIKVSVSEIRNVCNDIRRQLNLLEV